MKTVLPIDIVTLGEDNSYHLFVSGAINGRKYDLLIDTGASHTIFDAILIPEAPASKAAGQKIQSAGIHAGELKSSIGRIRKFKLGDLKCSNWTVILIDLTHVNDLYKKFTKKRVAGLIGSDFMLKHKAIIDYKKRELVLRNIKQKRNEK
ncbi:MAG: retroviral-like aspartic protease family protein [Tannerella sp.]|nr:retroviral-like aspartic protease family protein [Tannerella sp.]